MDVFGHSIDQFISRYDHTTFIIDMPSDEPLSSFISDENDYSERQCWQPVYAVQWHGSQSCWDRFQVNNERRDNDFNADSKPYCTITEQAVHNTNNPRATRKHCKHLRNDNGDEERRLSGS